MCGWEHPRVPLVKWLWKEEATEAVLDFLQDTRVGCMVTVRRPLEDEGGYSDNEEGGPGPPQNVLFSVLSFASFPLSSHLFPLFRGLLGGEGGVLLGLITNTVYSRGPGQRHNDLPSSAFYHYI